MPDFDSAGTRIEYYLNGPEDGAPTILVHGFCSNFQLNWVGSRWVDALAGAGRLVIGIDNRGHGQSDKPHRPEDYGPRMVGDVLNLVDHLGLAKVDYVGYSMGSQIGLHLVVNHPERVGRAVMGGIGLNVTTPWRHAEAVARRMRGEDVPDSPAAAMFYNFAVTVPGNDLEALAACILGRNEPLSNAQLAAIRTPLLVAVGGADPIARDARGLANLIPTAEYFEIPGRDHTTAVPSRAIKERALEFLES